MEYDLEDRYNAAVTVTLGKLVSDQVLLLLMYVIADLLAQYGRERLTSDTQDFRL